MQSDLLAIHLTDHVAGAAAGSRRMRRLAEAEAQAEDGEQLQVVADEIEEDRQQLLGLLEREHIGTRWYKAALARAAELVGLLKTNGRLVRRSPLTSVVELEGMMMAVTGKRALWTALQTTGLAADLDLDTLIRRADGQLGALSVAHQRRVAALT